MDFIRITALTDIGNNIAYSSLIPVVDMAGTPTTKKANLQIVANLVLSGAGGSYFAPAARAILAQSVTNAAQPNITSVGTLSSLTVSGNIGVGNVNATGTLFTSGVSATGTASLTTLNISTSANLGAVSNVTITGGSNGQVLTTNGTGGLSWTTVSGGSDYGNSNVASYLPTYTGNIGANTIRSTTASGSNLQIVANNAVFTFGQGGALYWPGGTNVWAIEPNIDDEFEIKSTSNVVISTDISNANSHFTFDTDGIFTAPSNVNLLGSRLNVGPDAATAGNLLNPTLIIANTGAQYIQAAIINNDGAGSSDWSADGAGGGDTEAWTDMGFAGFSFNDANYTITEPGDGYLFVQGYANGLGGNMVLATGDHSNTADIIFATGGFLANNEFARIDHSTDSFVFARPNSSIQFADGSTITENLEGTGDFGVVTPANVGFMIETDGANAYSWTFGKDGLLTLPGGNLQIGSLFGGEAITAASNVPLGMISQGGNGGTVVQWADDLANTNLLSVISINEPTGNIGDIRVQTGNTMTPNIWSFGNDGNLTLPGNTFAVNYANGTQVSLGGAGNTGNVTFSNITIQGDNNGLNLSAGPDYTANLAFLQVRAGDVASHIHLDTGNNSAYDLIVGDDQNYVQVSSTGNILLSSYDSNTSQYTWTLDYNGNLILAGGNSVIQSIANSSLDPLIPNVSTMVLTPDANYSSQVLVLDPTAPGHIHLRAYAFSNIDEPAANIFLGGEDTSFEVTSGAGNQARINSGGNTWTFDPSGQLLFPGNQGFIYSPGGSDLRILNNQNAGFVQLGWQDGAVLTPGANIASNVTLNSSGVTLTTTNDTFTTTNDWVFGITGTLTAPTNSIIQGTANLDIYSGDGNAIGGNLTLAAGTGNIGGDVGIFGGFGNVTDGGNVIIQGGVADSTGKGGNVEVRGGTGNIGGDILIAGGASTNVSPVTGNVEITGGNVIVKAWTFDDTGNLTFGVGNEPVIKWSTAPVSNTSEGYAGQAAYDSGGNLFVCVATNTWAKFSGTTSW